MEEKTCITFPVLGEPAPDFEAVTTHGPLKLSSLKGKWVVLFSHPADFTPVCTTEFMAFANIHDELKSLNVQTDRAISRQYLGTPGLGACNKGEDGS